MAKRKDKKRTAQLFSDLLEMSASTQPSSATHELTRMGKFRFQLLHEWLIENFAPCRVADIGGGKGLLAYLLQQSGWDATVIDPAFQTLPDKYKDLTMGKRVRIASTEHVAHLDVAFESSMAQDFDLLVGMHAHGCNVKIIDGAVTSGASFVLMPCCIIDEPVYPPRGIHWLQCLVDYAIDQGRAVQPFRLNFGGQNIGFYSMPSNCKMPGFPEVKKPGIAVSD
jgi:hypothetical protein